MNQLLHNPEFLKIAFLLTSTAAGLLLLLLILRHLRSKLVSPSEEKPRVAADENRGFTFAAYTGVIQKIKEQERELEQLRRTERERASESASLSDAVLTNLGSGVLVFNKSLLVRQANPAARELLGYSSPSGLHARDIFRGVTQVRLPAEMQESDAALADSGEVTLQRAVELAVKDGRSFRRLEADHKTPGGEERVLGVTVSAVRSGEENLGAVCLISDLTEVTALGRQLRLQEEMAALGEMSAGIAHEFKNSLATISGYAQMLAEDQAGPATREFAGRINLEASSLARVVTDFLNFARPQGLNREAVNLKEVLEACAAETGAVLVLPEDGPASWEVAGDSTALHRAFSNLLRNAVEAARPETPAEVRVTANVDGPRLRLRLEDNGSGIPPEVLPHIFIPFYTTKTRGTGLGLALVHRIVQEHGGTIMAESSGKGTAFTITLPREKAGKSAAKPG